MKNEIRFTLESKQRPKLAQEIGNILGTAVFCQALFPKKSIRIPCF